MDRAAADEVEAFWLFLIGRSSPRPRAGRIGQEQEPFQGILADFREKSRQNEGKTRFSVERNRKVDSCIKLTELMKNHERRD